MEPIYVLLRSVLLPWLHLWFRWTIEGAENIPARGPAILAFNHIAFLDPLAAAYVVDRTGRRPRFLAKSELFQDKRIRWLLKGAGQIEVRRGTRDAPIALDKAVKALSKGEIIVIFPEGTITTDPDLYPMDAKSGLARLALATSAPVIPCALWGTQNVWPKGFEAHWRPRQDILVRVGEPMPVEGDLEDRGSWDGLGAAVMERIALLLASLRPVVPDRRRPLKKSAA
ncbi:MAG TPA: lysophospholipid acyltransferase family protein [Actinomycetota bacterium]|nr:lysophospholipid acyltransferase family protein [Actinomycetota bacterium]